MMPDDIHISQEVLVFSGASEGVDRIAEIFQFVTITVLINNTGTSTLGNVSESNLMRQPRWSISVSRQIPHLALPNLLDSPPCRRIRSRSAPCSPSSAEPVTLKFEPPHRSHADTPDIPASPTSSCIRGLTVRPLEGGTEACLILSLRLTWRPRHFVKPGLRPR